MNWIDYMPSDKFATRVYCTSIGLSLLCFYYLGKRLFSDIRWFTISMVEFGLYNLIDEAVGRACVADWWEVVIAVAILIHNFADRNGWITRTRKTLWIWMKTIPNKVLYLIHRLIVFLAKNLVSLWHLLKQRLWRSSKR